MLLGSVTSEAGTGGNIHASVCAVEPDGGQVRLQKDATTISYGAQSDALLITARRAPDAAASDQVMLVALRGDYQLERTARLGCAGHARHLQRWLSPLPDGGREQVLPVPFAEIASQTMLPVSHLLWSSVWLGIAPTRWTRARAYLRQQGREQSSAVAEWLSVAHGQRRLLQLMQSRLSLALKDYEATFADGAACSPLDFTART